MKGTIILEGYCTAKVLKVGDATESGKVFEAAQVEEGGSTPLSEELDGLADLITKASMCLPPLSSLDVSSSISIWVMPTSLPAMDG